MQNAENVFDDTNELEKLGVDLIAGKSPQQPENDNESTNAPQCASVPSRGGGLLSPVLWGEPFLSMKTYFQKLKDPRWQRKRLEILKRDDFTCRVCESKTKTLHVHHIRYFKGREPWDYKEFYLVTLCEDCHEEEEASIKSSRMVTRPFTKQPHALDLDHRNSLSPEESREPTPEELENFFLGLKSMLPK